MILVDSSVWVEMLRDTGSPEDRRLRALLNSTEEIATSEPIAMELFAGAKTTLQRRQVGGVLAACRMLSVSGPIDWEAAAAVHRACRRAGVTPRRMLHCLIATVAIRAGVPVLAKDRDYELIAEHTALELAR